MSKNLELEVLDKQSLHWEKNFSNRPDMFGTDASVAAVYTLDQFKKNNFKNIVELGSGQGRDSIFFAKNGLNIQSLDYSQSGIKRIQEKSTQLGLGNLLDAKIFDVRERLPFDDNSIDGCYSHMLYCMALSFEEIENLNNEVHRVLKKAQLHGQYYQSIFPNDFPLDYSILEKNYRAFKSVQHKFSPKTFSIISPKNILPLSIKEWDHAEQFMNLKHYEDGRLRIYNALPIPLTVTNIYSSDSFILNTPIKIEGSKTEDKYLEIKEDLAVKIKDSVEKIGLSFAFPSQSIYIEKTQSQ